MFEYRLISAPTMKSAAVASATDADVRGPSNTFVTPAGNGDGLAVPQLCMRYFSFTSLLVMTCMAGQSTCNQ